MYFFLRKCLWTWGLGDGWLCLSALSWRWTTSPLTENWPPFSSRSCTWKSFHNAILEKVPFKKAQILTCLFKCQLQCLWRYQFILFSAFDHLLHQLPDLILDTPDAPEILGNFLARSIADDCIPPKFLHRWIIRAFFRVKNRPNLNSCQKQFPSSNSCMTWTFLRQSNPRALWKSL